MAIFCTAHVLYGSSFTCGRLWSAGGSRWRAAGARSDRKGGYMSVSAQFGCETGAPGRLHHPRENSATKGGGWARPWEGARQVSGAELRTNFTELPTDCARLAPIPALRHLFCHTSNSKHSQPLSTRSLLTPRMVQVSTNARRSRFEYALSSCGWTPGSSPQPLERSPCTNAQNGAPGSPTQEQSAHWCSLTARARGAHARQRALGAPYEGGAGGAAGGGALQQTGGGGPPVPGR